MRSLSYSCNCHETSVSLHPIVRGKQCWYVLKGNRQKRLATWKTKLRHVISYSSKILTNSACHAVQTLFENPGISVVLVVFRRLGQERGIVSHNQTNRDIYGPHRQHHSTPPCSRPQHHRFRTCLQGSIELPRGPTRGSFEPLMALLHSS